MIAKVTKGKRAGGALRYDFGPGHREEHKDPRIVAGSVPGTPQQVARIIDRHNRRRSDVARPIWRCSLSLPDEDGVLTDERWGQIAEQYVGRMWGPDVPWVAVRHGDDHVHLTVSRVRWSGELASDSHDYARSRPIVRALEAEHGLTNAEERSNRVAPQVSGPERAAAQRRGAERPEREQLRELVRAARDASAGGGREAFEAALEEAGVGYRANVAKGGRMSGYSFSLPGWTDGEGAQVWAAASKVSRELRWDELRSTLDNPDLRTAPATPAPATEPAREPQPARVPEPAREPQPTRERQETPAPQPTPEPEPAQEPQPTRIPEPAPEPQPTRVPQPTQEPQPTRVPEPAREPQQAPESQPAQEPRTTPEPEPAREPEPTPEPQPTPEPEPARVPPKPSRPPLTPAQAAAAQWLVGQNRERPARAARSRSSTTGTGRTSTTRSTGPSAQPHRPPEPPQPGHGRDL
ncbi:relaxase/mobilization nuclease domain-containing protein [Streptomyces sp. NPDC001774]